MLELQIKGPQLFFSLGTKKLNAHILYNGIFDKGTEFENFVLKLGYFICVGDVTEGTTIVYEMKGDVLNFIPTTTTKNKTKMNINGRKNLYIP